MLLCGLDVGLVSISRAKGLMCIGKFNKSSRVKVLRWIRSWGSFISPPIILRLLTFRFRVKAQF